MHRRKILDFLTDLEYDSILKTQVCLFEEMNSMKINETEIISKMQKFFYSN